MSNRGRIVFEEDVEKALDFLRDSAKEIGDAKAETVRASHMLKVVKALAMKSNNEKTISQQERDALGSQEFRQALEEDAIAAGEYEKLRALREAASLKIEVFRTEAANFRAMKL